MEAESKTDSTVKSATGPRVEFAGEVLQQIRQHARSSMNAEICGVLMGSIANGVTHVTARIEGAGAAQGGAHVTFTQDTWEHIYKVKDSQYPSLSIVGWYHSHPGFGIFLSDYDLFIHENFFNAPHQIAWVFDPHSDEDGCFAWNGKKIEPLGEITVLKTARSQHLEQPQVQASTSADGQRDALVSTLTEHKQKSSYRPIGIFIAMLIVILAFLCGFFYRPHFGALKHAITTIVKLPTRQECPSFTPVFVPEPPRSKFTPPLPIDAPRSAVSPIPPQNDTLPKVNPQEHAQASEDSDPEK